MPLSSKLLLRRCGWPPADTPAVRSRDSLPSALPSRAWERAWLCRRLLPRQCSVALPNERFESLTIAVENIVIHEAIDSGYAFLFGILPEVPGRVVVDSRCGDHGANPNRDGGKPRRK